MYLFLSKKFRQPALQPDHFLSILSFILSTAQPESTRVCSLECIENAGNTFILHTSSVLAFY